MRGPGMAPLSILSRTARLSRERRAEVDGRGDAGLEQLPGGDLHDRRQRARALLGQPREPHAVVAVAEQDEMRVQLDHARHHRAAAGVDDGVAGRDRRRGGRTDPDDPVPLDEHGRVVQRRRFVAVEQHAANQRHLADGRLLGVRDGEGDDDEQRYQVAQRARRHGVSPGQAAGPASGRSAAGDEELADTIRPWSPSRCSQVVATLHARFAWNVRLAAAGPGDPGPGPRLYWLAAVPTLRYLSKKASARRQASRRMCARRKKWISPG